MKAQRVKACVDAMHERFPEMAARRVKARTTDFAEAIRNADESDVIEALRRHRKAVKWFDEAGFYESLRLVRAERARQNRPASTLPPEEPSPRHDKVKRWWEGADSRSREEAFSALLESLPDNSPYSRLARRVGEKVLRWQSFAPHVSAIIEEQEKQDGTGRTEHWI